MSEVSIVTGCYTGSFVCGMRMGYEFNTLHSDSRASMILCLETQLLKNDEVKSNLISGEMSCRGVKDVAGRKSPPPQQSNHSHSVALASSTTASASALLLIKIAKKRQKIQHPFLNSARK